MDVTRIAAILRDSFGELDDNQNPLPGTELVDVWMKIPLKPDKVREHADEMIELLKEWPSESWGQDIPPLGEEINYLAAGAVLDSQQHAFVLFAFGKLLDWWDVLDPCSLYGLEEWEVMARELAGMGMIVIRGYKPKLAA
jgi:hypothetical protein